MSCRSPFTQSRTVLFGECDPVGIIYTPRIADYMVEASLSFLSHKLGQPAERFISGLGIAIPARVLNVEFLKPMTWDETIDIEVHLADMGSSALTVSVTGRNASQDKTFTGQITMVCISLLQGRPVTVPEEMRRSLQS